MKRALTVVFLSSAITMFSYCNNNGRNMESNNETKISYLTKNDFLTKVANYVNNPSEWKYLGDKPCLIDFYASWCGPCKRIAPILEELAVEYGDQIHVYKIDTEKEQELSAVFGIRSIPALLFVPMEGKPTMINGALSKEEFQKVINDILLGKK